MPRTSPPDARVAVLHDASNCRENGHLPQFGFVMTPYRSMSDRAFGILILSILTVAFGVQLFFVAIGVWVAAAAALFDGLFLAGAFIACRNDRRRTETLRLEDGILTSTQRRGNGEVITSHEVPATGLLLRRKMDHDYGCLRLEIVQGGRCFEVASELSLGERLAFSDELIGSFRKAGIGIRLETY